MVFSFFSAAQNLIQNPGGSKCFSANGVPESLPSDNYLISRGNQNLKGLQESKVGRRRHLRCQIFLQFVKTFKSMLKVFLIEYC